MAKKKEAASETVEKPAGSRLKWIILILVALLLLGGGAGAAYYFLIYSSDDQDDSAESADASAQESEAAAPIQDRNAPDIYHQLEAFTVNVTAEGPIRFLRVKMTVVTRDERVVGAIDKHMPKIRNDLLSLLAGQEFASINTQEGKDAVREQLKEVITRILRQSGEPSAVEEVLFTDLVMQ